MTKLIDAQERLVALDPNQSFIIQAPAGSGKTELLTLRFLTLLEHVQTPEEILALTFTRKAAAEMQARIIKLLKMVKTNDSSDDENYKIELIQRVLERDRKLQWNILANPNRLKIQTIDSLCANIVKSMPILSQFGNQPQIAEDANLLYQQSAAALLTHLPLESELQQSFELLLLHLDNDYTKLNKLLISMLECRDQWLNYIIDTSNSAQLKHLLEQSLYQVNRDHLQKIQEKLPTYMLEELVALLNFAIHTLETKQSNSCIIQAKCLTEKNLKDLLQEKTAWLAVANFLLTQDGHIRKKITLNEGFPAPSSCKNQQEKQHFSIMKQRMESFLVQLNTYNDFCELLNDVRMLPPLEYNPEQWQILFALLQLLPRLVVELQLIFQQKNQVDYTEIALRTLTALGTAQEPSDITLALDNKIKHILVDEFQDTSVNQFRLIEQLTAGWIDHEGRSLFLVGDPMQSIYRFRKAEVGLFLQAIKHGIGNIHLSSLILKTNFRSNSAIIHWINTTFSHLMSPKNNLQHGAVEFSPSVARNTVDLTLDSDHHVFIHARNKFPNSHEGDLVVDIIRQTLKNNPAATIAILVRAKNHLADILPKLTAANLLYQAIEIETLADKAAIRDLLILTRALQHFGDKIAWLALLRAPWCGLSLHDIYALNKQDLNGTVWELLLTANLKQLSNDGQLILKRVVPLLQQRINLRGKQNLADWIEGTWLILGGPATLNHSSELEETNLFFKFLRKIQFSDQIDDPRYLEAQLNKLFAKPKTTHCQIEAMTIHKAKGLEFDTVIIPGLERSLTSDDSKLMLYQEKPCGDGDIHLFLAPIKASEVKMDPIYEFLRNEEKKLAENETIRLLYVAATRAKSNLHLIGWVDTEKSPAIPAKNTLLAKLWPQIAAHFSENHPVTTTISIATSNPGKRLKRLKPQWQLAEFVQQIIQENTLEPTQEQAYSPSLTIL